MRKDQMESIRPPQQQQKQKPSYVLNICVSTWDKSQHGLFSYDEGSKIDDKNYQMSINVKRIYIYQNLASRKLVLLNNILPKNKIQEKSKNLTEVCSINVTKNTKTGKLIFDFQLNQSYEKAVGIPVSKQLNLGGQPNIKYLKPGNIISFGSSKYLVREIRQFGQKIKRYENFVKQQSTIYEVQTKQNTILSQNSTHDHDEQIQCKICYDSQSTAKNPLIKSPCSCAGSCNYIHLECLQNWVKIKAVIKYKQFCTVIDKINCEICKSEIRLPICSHHQLVEAQKSPKGPYIILETVNSPSRKILILKNFPQEGISIGRSNSCYIKLNDISVSCVHAFMKFSSQEGKFYLQDQDSKFGTVIIESPLQIQVGKTEKCIQIKNNILKFCAKKTGEVLLKKLYE